MKKCKRLTVLVALLLAAFSGAALAKTKTLVFCSEGSPEGFDPGQYMTGTTFDASAVQLYSRLTEFERGSTNLIPGLAEKWEVAKDGLSITFHLRKNVKFHSTEFFTPTRALNSSDVLFTFERMIKREHPFHKSAPKGFPYADSMGLSDSIEAIERIDDATIRFVLKAPEAPFLANLAMSFASILSAEYAEQLAKQGKPQNLNLQPIGTGPFVLKSYQQDQQIRYEAFAGYYLGKQPLDRLVFVITTDPSVRYQKLKAGECQVSVYPRPADVAAMKQDPRIHLLGQNGLNIGYLAFNMEKKPFDNRMVREALTLAINRAAIVQAVYQGAGAAAKNPIPPTLWSYDEKTKDFPYDPAKAKETLAKAGFANGFATTLWAMPVQRPYNPNARQMAEMIQADWAKIGVKASIQSFEWGEYIKRAKSAEHETLLMGWTGDNGDPDNFFAPNLSCEAAKSGENYARWCNKEFNSLIVKAKATTDQQERAALYVKAQEIFHQDLPWVTIAHSYVYQPVRKEVIGFKMSPFGLNEFAGVDLKD